LRPCLLATSQTAGLLEEVPPFLAQQGGCRRTRHDDGPPAVLVGTAMIVVALIDESLMLVQYLPQQPSIERDIAHLLTPFLAVLLPTGVALIPAGWLLAQLDNRIARRPGKSSVGDAR
jgi:hypothetical protein